MRDGGEDEGKAVKAPEGQDGAAATCAGTDRSAPALIGRRTQPPPIKDSSIQNRRKYEGALNTWDEVAAGILAPQRGPAESDANVDSIIAAATKVIEAFDKSRVERTAAISGGAGA